MLEIRTTEELEDVSLDKLRICYLDPFTGTKSRKSALKKNYYFDCKCQHCDGGFEYNMFYRNTGKICTKDIILHSGDLLEKVESYINENYVDIDAAKEIMEKIVEKVSIESIIFLQVSKLLFNQCLQDGKAVDALKYGELCRKAYRSQTKLNPLGNLQTLVKLARVHKSCDTELDDLVTEMIEIERIYFKTDENRERYIFCIERER